MKKSHRTVLQNAWCKKNTIIEKTIVLQKSLQIHMKNRHRTVFQNAWSQKITHSHGIKKLLLLQKSLQVHMKKGHRTVFQNPWSQKNQHSHWKNNSVSKKLTNSYEKRTRNRLPKCLNPKKTTLSLKKQFCFKKAYKFIWKKTVFQNAWSKKNQHSHWKKQFCFKKADKFIWKNATEPFSKMREAKKTNTLIEKNNSVSKKLINSYEKRQQNRFPKCRKPKK